MKKIFQNKTKESSLEEFIMYGKYLYVCLERIINRIWFFDDTVNLEEEVDFWLYLAKNKLYSKNKSVQDVALLLSEMKNLYKERFSSSV